MIYQANEYAVGIASNLRGLVGAQPGRLTGNACGHEGMKFAGCDFVIAVSVSVAFHALHQEIAEQALLGFGQAGGGLRPGRGGDQRKAFRHTFVTGRQAEPSGVRHQRFFPPGTAR